MTLIQCSKELDRLGDVATFEDFFKLAKNFEDELECSNFLLSWVWDHPIFMALGLVGLLYPLAKKSVGRLFQKKRSYKPSTAKLGHSFRKSKRKSIVNNY